MLPCTLQDLNEALQATSCVHSTFEFKLIECTDVHQQIVTSASGSLSPGPDGIAPSNVKMLVTSLTPTLTHIFNHCLEHSVYLIVWKKSHIKVNSPRTPADTRPIANLCEISKVFERLIYKQIVDYLNENHLHDPYQLGYKKHHSTQTALLKLCHDVKLAVDKRKVTILVLFDFSKAFDMVSYSVLQKKLTKMGFSATALKFIHSYLTDRSQCVVDTMNDDF